MVGAALVKVAPIAASAGIGALAASRSKKSQVVEVTHGPGDREESTILIPRARRSYSAAERFAWKISQEETKRVIVHDLIQLIREPMVLALGTVVLIETLQKAGLVGSIVGTLAEGLAAAPVVVDLTKAGAQTVEKVAPAITALASALAPMLAAIPGGRS